MTDGAPPQDADTAIRLFIGLFTLGFVLSGIDNLFRGEWTLGIVSCGIGALCAVVDFKWSSIKQRAMNLFATTTLVQQRRYKWSFVFVAAALCAGVTTVTFQSRLLPPIRAPVDSTNPALGSPSVQISECTLLNSETGTSPSDKVLYNFKIHGKYSINDRAKYGLVVFYRPLGYNDQRYGWFAVVKLDHDGFAVPNWLELDAQPPSEWTLFTSRIYLPPDIKPLLIFRAYLLPIAKLKELQEQIVDQQLGWGRDSLAFFGEQAGAFSSSEFAFEPAH